MLQQEFLKGEEVENYKHSHMLKANGTERSIKQSKQKLNGDMVEEV